MPTTRRQVVLSSTAPSPSSTSPAAHNPLSDTSTLLFGFLVSALSIFGIFMMSAIIWNRLVARRRAIDAMLAINPPQEPQELRRPLLWNVWAMPDKQSPPWLDVKPVAAQKCYCFANPVWATQTDHTIPFWRHRLLNRLPPEITYLFHQPITQAPSASRDTNTSQVELSNGSDIQILLLISMPHEPQSKKDVNHKHRQRLHEMVFATTNVLYHDPAQS